MPDRDVMLRAELARRLAGIERAMGACPAGPRTVATRMLPRRPLAEVSALREIARANGLMPVERLAAGLAMALGAGAGRASCRLWLDGLGDAIVGTANGADAADAYVAAVMVRLGA